MTQIKNLLIPRILTKLAIAFVQAFPMCFLKLRFWSSPPPRYLTYLLTWMRLLSNTTSVVVHLLICLWFPISINLLLSQLSFSLISHIHDAIFETAFLSISSVSSSCCLSDALKAFLIEWLSA